MCHPDMMVGALSQDMGGSGGGGVNRICGVCLYTPVPEPVHVYISHANMYC